jgi:hypothetical protein
MNGKIKEKRKLRDTMVALMGSSFTGLFGFAFLELAFLSSEIF